MTKTRSVELKIDLLRARFYVDGTSDSGLRMRIRSQPAAHNPKVIRNPGDIAGFKNMYGYWEVAVGKAYLKVHRIVWIITIGQIPDGLEIDHKDGNASNNCIDNLQLLTGGANARARNRLYRCNKTGYVGVNRITNHSWQASIRRNTILRYLGKFSCPVRAARAYNAAAIAWAKEHGEIPRFLNPV